MPHVNPEEAKNYRKAYKLKNAARMKEYRRKYYLEHKELINAQVMVYREINKEWWLAYKSAWQRDKASAQREVIRAIINSAKSVRCMDCKHKYPTCVMDFDHVRGKKLINLGHAQAKWAYSPTKVKAEIAKCDVVCANCHRIRTHITRSRK